jgi:hypothetical protein
MSDLRVQIADVIVRKVLQEDYDDLVEGYLDEILMAADQIILLPAYKAVSQAYYDKLSSPVVPVGREEITAILESHIGAAAWSGDAEVHGIPEAADAILAALGTKATDTGREG